MVLNQIGAIMKKVLLVDDEPNVLNALRRELRDRFEIEAFVSPVAALDRCRETRFDLVLADYKMPDMSGLEFLTQFGQLQPEASRLLLSGHADIDVLTRIINETHIYRFLAKPWDKAELLSVIDQALACQDAVIKSRHRPAPGKATASSGNGTVFRIVLVESDDHLLDLMSHALTDDSDQESLYSAIQQELTQEASSGTFKCTVAGFHDAQSALAHLANNPCDLIVSAQNLQDMDGIQLLSITRQFIPEAARILISTDPDKTMVAQAINEAEVQNLLHLHWVNYELRADAQRQAWNLYQLKTAVIHALASRALLRG